MRSRSRTAIQSRILFTRNSMSAIENVERRSHAPGNCRITLDPSRALNEERQARQWHTHLRTVNIAHLVASTLHQTACLIALLSNYVAEEGYGD